MVPSESGSAKTSAARPVPIRTMSPISGTTSATTASGANRAMKPNSITRKPTSRSSQVIIVFCDSAVANICSLVCRPISSNSTSPVAAW